MPASRGRRHRSRCATNGVGPRRIWTWAGRTSRSRSNTTATIIGRFAPNTPRTSAGPRCSSDTDGSSSGSSPSITPTTSSAGCVMLELAAGNHAAKKRAENRSEVTSAGKEGPEYERGQRSSRQAAVDEQRRQRRQRQHQCTQPHPAHAGIALDRLVADLLLQRRVDGLQLLQRRCVVGVPTRELGDLLERLVVY